MKEQLSQITPVQAVVFSAIIVGFYWLTFYDSGKKEQQRLDSAKTSFEQKTKEFEKLTKSLNEARRYKQLSEKLSEQLERIAGAVPSYTGEDEKNNDGLGEKRDLERMLSQQVRDVGAELKSVSAGSWAEVKKTDLKNVDKLDGKFESIDLSLNIECSFRHVMVLLSNLTKSGASDTTSRIFTIDSLSVSPQGDGSQLKKNQPLLVSFNVKLRTYRYRLKSKKPEAS